MLWHVALISAPLMGMKLENALYSAENAYFFRLIPPYLRYNSQDCNLDNFIYGDRPKIVLPSRNWERLLPTAPTWLHNDLPQS
jgi:hypothetical protein